MNNKITTLAVMVFVLFITGAGKVKVYVDDSKTDYIMADKMDCTITKVKENGIIVGFKVGNFLLNTGPEFGFRVGSGVKWDQTVQGIVARYQELCGRFNTGIMSKKDYDERIREIDNLAKEAFELQERIKKNLQSRSDDRFEEMESETRKNGTNPESDKAKASAAGEIDKIFASVNKVVTYPVTLVTEEEAGQADLPAGTFEAAEALDEGPIVQVKTPDSKGEYQRPLSIVVDFISRDGKDPDLSTLKVEYMKFFAIDITDRVLPYATKSGIKIDKADFPVGNHKIRLTIGDVSGALSSQQFDVIVK